VTIGTPVINARDDSWVWGTQSNTFTLTGYGLDSTIKLKVVNTACNANNDDQDDIVTGGDGVALSGNNPRTTSVDKAFTLRTAATAAKLCVLIPTTSGGSGSYTDTGLVVEIRGTAMVHELCRSVGCCSLLLVTVGCCSLLVIAGHCWSLLVIAGHCWSLLFSIVHCCSLFFASTTTIMHYTITHHTTTTTTTYH
jgi:hypothetical protein